MIWEDAWWVADARWDILVRANAYFAVASYAFTLTCILYMVSTTDTITDNIFPYDTALGERFCVSVCTFICFEHMKTLLSYFDDIYNLQIKQFHLILWLWPGWYHPLMCHRHILLLALVKLDLYELHSKFSLKKKVRVLWFTCCFNCCHQSCTCGPDYHTLSLLYSSLKDKQSVLQTSEQACDLVHLVMVLSRK